LSPLLLLHGFLGSPESFAGLSLTASDVFAPLLVGHTGRELGPEVGPHAGRKARRALSIDTCDERAFEEEVDRMAAWATGRGFTRGTLLGYSLGARLGLGLVVRHAALFERAILVSAHPGLPDEVQREERRMRDREHCRALLRRGVEAFVGAWERLPLFASQSALPRAVRDEQRRVRTSHDALGLVQSLLHTGLGVMPDYSPHLAAIEVPVTLLTGALDARFAVLARAMRRQNARFDWQQLPAAGHNLLLERPDAIRETLFT
jgi:2-succinyl-6-hydroxy-2,4-cyclohexadiene-1-carboxylate synthase